MSGNRPAVALIDARNVLRSTWPNIPEEELVELCVRWAATEGCRAVVVFDGPAPDVPGEPGLDVVASGGESADDWIAREAAALSERGEPFWLVTSDRGLRTRAAAGAERTIGGGAFARTLMSLRGPDR